MPLWGGPPAAGALCGVGGAQAEDLSWAPLPQLRPGVPVGAGDGRSWSEGPGSEHQAKKDCERMPCLCGGRRLAGWEDHRQGQKREGEGTGRRPPATWGRLRSPSPAGAADLPGREPCPVPCALGAALGWCATVAASKVPSCARGLVFVLL